MIENSTEGFTLALFFDWIIILLTVLGPFVLPILARFGKIMRVMAGLTLISLGVLLGALVFGFIPLDPKKHFVLVNIAELISLMLLPLSLILFIILPPLYVWLGVRLLVGTQLLPTDQRLRWFIGGAATLFIGAVAVGPAAVMLLNWLRSPPLPSPPPAAEMLAKRRDSVLSVTPGSGETFQDRLANGEPCPACPPMVVVPAGEFLMGSTPSEIDMLTKEPSLRAPPRAAEFSKKEQPQHRVTIARPFAVGSFAVTFAEWNACVADGGCNGYLPEDAGWGRGKQPIISVNWDDAQRYAAWLSRKTGHTYRLLSEAEREYVTRAGTTTAFWWGSSISTNQANFYGRGKTVAVDSFQPNPWGLYNVHGNLSDWVEDCWHDDYQGAPSDGSAWTTACPEGIRRMNVARGGSWSEFPWTLRAANRFSLPSSARTLNAGFRLARTINP